MNSGCSMAPEGIAAEHGGSTMPYQPPLPPKSRYFLPTTNLLLSIQSIESRFESSRVEHVSSVSARAKANDNVEDKATIARRQKNKNGQRALGGLVLGTSCADDPAAYHGTLLTILPAESLRIGGLTHSLEKCERRFAADFKTKTQHLAERIVLYAHILREQHPGGKLRQRLRQAFSELVGDLTQFLNEKQLLSAEVRQFERRMFARVSTHRHDGASRTALAVARVAPATDLPTTIAMVWELSGFFLGPNGAKRHTDITAPAPTPTPRTTSITTRAHSHDFVIDGMDPPQDNGAEEDDGAVLRREINTNHNQFESTVSGAVSSTLKLRSKVSWKVTNYIGIRVITALKLFILVLELGFSIQIAVKYHKVRT